EHAEAPRVREVVIRSPGGEIEQLVEQLARNRLGAVDLVRAARADGGLDVESERLGLADLEGHRATRRAARGPAAAAARAGPRGTSYVPTDRPRCGRSRARRPRPP